MALTGLAIMFAHSHDLPLAGCCASVSIPYICELVLLGQFVDTKCSINQDEGTAMPPVGTSKTGNQ